MNLLNILDNELKNKHYNNFEKVRYIYLRTCELFSFDARYYFVEIFNKKLFNNIIDKKIDITNVDDFLVICHSYSKYVLLRLVNELTTANVSLHSGPHSFVEYKDDDDLIKWIREKVLTIDIDKVVSIKVSGPNRGLVSKESKYVFRDFWKQQMEIVRAFLERSQYQEMEDKEH